MIKKKIIGRENFLIMPWKNGSGVSAQIDILPTNASIDRMNFDWRVSSALIKEESSFSSYPGYDRIMTVVSGDGLLVNGDELSPFEVLNFAGEDLVEAAPINGAIEDIGVIFLREKYDCFLQIIEINQSRSLELKDCIYFFMPLLNQISIDGAEVHSGEFLKIESSGGNCEIIIECDQSPGYLLQISIEAKAKSKVQ